ncbi:MAG TPA: rod shape-determining protein MreC [Pyrinomonadaceae bacterium]|jgi:rod shape-determining protein MreC|nr:rod shape-determining protein MreC [Pyrinomonadaceae bacterium]
MVRSTQKEIRQRAPLWLLVLLALNFGLMTWDAKDASTKQRVIRVWAQSALSPAQRVTTGLGGAGLGFFHGLAEMRDARAENQTLKERLAEDENELRDARAARDENERLKKLLDFAQDVSYKTIPARVIARDPSVWFNSLIINRGTVSGVDLDMPVVTPEGIVGRVVGVGPVSAQVMLITDERSAAGAVVGQLGQSNALGSVRGFGKNGLLEMRYVSGLETVNVGDYVVTTGQDRIYPPGLNVGAVVEVKQGTTTTPHTIYVRPGARLESLQEVAVLDYRPQQRTAPEKTLPNVDKGKGK